MSNSEYHFPIEELQKDIDAGFSKMSTSERSLWQNLNIKPEKWVLTPWGDEGGGFWVVAIYGNTCIYYNDIEEGFNTSSYAEYGRIDKYFCDQDELQWVIHRLMESILAG